MRKSFIATGLILFFLGIILVFLSGATFGNFQIPLIYGSNQILWLFLAVIGFIALVIGLILKKKEGKKKIPEGKNE